MCVEVFECPVCRSGMVHSMDGIYKCPECNHWKDFVSVPMSQEYCDEKMRGVTNHRDMENDHDRARMKARWGMVLRHAKGCESLLDYGCADNVFIKNAPANHGFKELIGFDTNWLTGFSDERRLDRPYDVLTMWHSLEHTPFPRMVVDRVEHKYLFLIIPWVEYLTLEDLPTTWIFQHGQHINMYSRKSLFKTLHDYDILEENYEDSVFISNCGNEVVGFALRKKNV